MYDSTPSLGYTVADMDTLWASKISGVLISETTHYIMKLRLG